MCALMTSYDDDDDEDNNNIDRRCDAYVSNTKRKPCLLFNLFAVRITSVAVRCIHADIQCGCQNSLIMRDVITMRGKCHAVLSRVTIRPSVRHTAACIVSSRRNILHFLYGPPSFPLPLPDTGAKF